MANLIPIVTPAHESEGIDVQYSPTAIFEKEMEKGTLTATSCFMVEIPTKIGETLEAYMANSSMLDILESSVNIIRINKSNEDIYQGKDYGDENDSGEKYRTKLEISPLYPLKPNTTYAILLSKDISTITVFDAKRDANNTGTGELETKGSYKGITAESYTIMIAQSGSEHTATYIWKRNSDNHMSSIQSIHSGYIEIENGLYIRFEDGMYNTADSFTINVRPEDKQTEIINWEYSTGSAGYAQPEDENSNKLINLPVAGEEASQSDDVLKVTSISPENATSMLPIPKKATINNQ